MGDAGIAKDAAIEVWGLYKEGKQTLMFHRLGMPEVNQIHHRNQHGIVNYSSDFCITLP